MSQIQMTNEERRAALRTFGYGEREANFLCLAALHGGYFLRRQYGDFLGKSPGGTVAALVQKLLANGHAKVSVFAQNTHVYHLCARPFYAAMGQADNRNRRNRQPATIKNKLMCLDYVLAHGANTFLATEQEKLEYFAGALGIGLEKLPLKQYSSRRTHARTARYFVDKYPIFLSATENSDPPVVSFCFVDEGLATDSRFDTYLAQYGALLDALERFRMVYVAATAVPFRAAERTFRKLQAERGRGGVSTLGGGSLRRLTEHFAARQAYENRSLAGFDRTKLIRFRDERQEFSGKPFDALYAVWQTEGEAALARGLVADVDAPAAGQAVFSTYLLEHSYDLFGGVTAF